MAKRILLLLFSITLLFVALDKDVIAHYTYIGGEDDSEGVDDLQDEIEELEEKIAKLQNDEKTLQNEISYFDSQISLTQLRIQNAEAEIAKRNKLLSELVVDIADISERIEKLSDSIEYQRNILQERMRARYKSQASSPVVILFGSDTLSIAVKKAEYLKVMQRQDQELLNQMESTKQAYSLQKNLFEEKKNETEELKAKVEAEKANLVVYRTQLDDQKLAKQSLLEKTQNDEAKFQELLADAKRELAQIVNAASALQGTEPKNVDKGDVIGIQGNTGYSFGDHLHFGVYRYSSIDDISGWNWYHSNTVNPKKKLKAKEVYWNTGCESSGTRTVGEGSWSWPLSNPTVSQGYGHTCYSDTYYGGKDHPAYDMYGPYSTPVYAVDDGKAYFCRNCLGDGGNGVFIFHDDDYMTVYWHLQ